MLSASSLPVLSTTHDPSHSCFLRSTNQAVLQYINLNANSAHGPPYDATLAHTLSQWKKVWHEKSKVGIALKKPRIVDACRV